jgi:hypothetical protein
MSDTSVIKKDNQGPPPTPAPQGEINTVQEQHAVKKLNRGLLPYVVLISTPVNAKDVDRRIKHGLTLIVSLAGMAAPLGSTILMRK